MLALSYTHLNTVIGRLLCIYAFKTIDALWTLNDISKPGPDKPLRISAFGRFWWVKSRKLWPGVKARQGRGSFHIIGAASPLFTALQVFSNGEKRSTTRVIIDVAVFDQTALHIAHAVMINPTQRQPHASDSASRRRRAMA